MTKVQNTQKKRKWHIVQVMMIVFFVIASYNIVVILMKSKKEPGWLLTIGTGALIFTGIIMTVFFFKCEIERRRSLEIQKELKEEIIGLQQNELRLQEANQAKSRFLSKMSKQLRAPINSILGVDELILKEDNHQAIIQHASMIQKAGQQLHRLISDVLELTLIEENKLEIIEKEYSTKEMLEELIQKSKKVANENKLIFELLIDETVPSKLLGDKNRVIQSLFYILSNAVKYTPIGSITFCMGWENKAEGEVDLIFTVADTGVGIKEEEVRELFESFQLIGENSLSRMEGTGLGLTITTKLLAAMGSKLEIESEYGQGTIFSFRLGQKVLDKEEMGSLENNTDNIPIPLVEKKGFLAPNVRLLAVDDNEINLAVIKGLLAPTRIQVDLALSGKEAIQKAMENQYHVILMDHLMPEMNGIETQDYLQMFEENLSKDAAIIILTAEIGEKERETYLNHGFTDYLPKPVENEKLEQILSKHIPDDMLIKADTHEEKIAEQVLNIKKDIEEMEEKTSEGLALQLQLEKNLGIYVQEGLRYFDGNVEQYRSILTLFLEDAPEKYGKLSYAIAQDSCGEYEIIVHSLKSNAKNVGAMEIGKMAQELEDLCHNGQWDQVKKRHNRFGRKLKDMMDGLKELEQGPIIYDDTPTSMNNDEVLIKVREIEKHLLDFELDLAGIKLDKLVRVHTSEDVHKILVKALKQMESENYDGLVEQLEKISML